MGFVVRRGAVGAGRDRDSHGAPRCTPGFPFLKAYKVLSSPGIDGVGEIRPR